MAVIAVMGGDDSAVCKQLLRYADLEGIGLLHGPAEKLVQGVDLVCLARQLLLIDPKES